MIKSTLPNIKGVRRTFASYLSYLVLLFICITKLSIFDAAGRFYWIFIGLCSLIILTRLVFKPYYFEIRGARLIINRDLFSEDYVEINDIEKIELEEGLFSNSYIKLKDYKMGLHFNYFIVNDKDFKRLKEEYNLQIG